MVPLWIPIIIRHLLFRVPKKGHNFDNHPYILEPYSLRFEAHDVDVSIEARASPSDFEPFPQLLNLTWTPREGRIIAQNAYK